MTLPVRHFDDPRLKSQRRKAAWRQGTVLFGVALLLAGYSLLAVSPDTPSEWVLLRVAGGFGLLFIGFALAVVPWLSRTVGSDE